MIVRELITRLAFDSDEQQVREYERSLDQAKTAAKVLTAAITGASVAAFGMAQSTANASEETLQWANRLGTTVEWLSRNVAIARQYGIQQQAIVDGLKEMSLRADEFVHTGAGPAVEAFKRLGIEAETLNRLSNDTAGMFELVRDRLSEVDNVAARQRIADELFGGQAGEQFPEFLRASTEELEEMGRVAERAGSVIGRDLAQESRKYNRELDQFRMILTGLRNSVGAELIPEMREMIETVNDWTAANSDLIRQNITRFIDMLRTVLEMAVAAGRPFVGILRQIVQFFGGLEGIIRLAAIALGLLFGRVAIGGLRRLAFGLLGATAAANRLRLMLRRIGLILLIEEVAAAFTETEGLFDSLVDKMEPFNDWLDNNFRDTIDSVFSEWDGFLATINQRWSESEDRLQNIKDDLLWFVDFATAGPFRRWVVEKWSGAPLSDEALEERRVNRVNQRMSMMGGAGGGMRQSNSNQINISITGENNPDMTALRVAEEVDQVVRSWVRDAQADFPETE